MWPFKQKKRDVEEVHQAVTVSFDKVKNDTNLLFQWVRYLHYQNQQLKGFIDNKMQSLPPTGVSKRDVQDIVNHRLVAVQKRLLTVDTKTKELIHHEIAYLKKDVRKDLVTVDKFQELFQKIKNVEQKVSSLAQPSMETIRPISRLQKKVMKTVAKHSKNYIQNFILNQIKKYNQISGTQLREMVVEDQKLCSKSTFYRLLVGLEHTENIVVRVEGKEKIYLFVTAKKHSFE